MLVIKEEYFSASTNRSLAVLDIWGDLLAFGSSNAVLLYDYQTCSILAKLNKHEDNVNCVRFFDSGNRILSCSGDKRAIIWRRSTADQPASYEVEHILTGHNASIDIGCSIVLADNSILTLTGSNDACVNVWKNDQLIACRQEKDFAFDIKLIASPTKLFQDKIIALVASSDSFVHLFAVDGQLQLTEIVKLSGHHEWVRSVDFVFQDEDTLMIASGAQDNFIRVWKLQERSSQTLNTDTFFELDGRCYSVVLDTVIAGHEDKVYCVRWLNNSVDRRLKLLSVSLDRSAILWEQPEEHTDQLWFEKYRLGEIGGNNLGLLNCVVSASHEHIIVNSFNGALHFWQFDGTCWNRRPIILGHFLPATDLHWDPNGRYLLSASLDATCRLHGVWKEQGASKDEDALKDERAGKDVDALKNDNCKRLAWFELARPQVHGYEINCIAPISSTEFVSGADEKVLRVYKATGSFVGSFEKITGVRCAHGDEKLADFAAVPNLGLSNYAVNESDLGDQNKALVFKPETFEQPPKEESLLTNTLWPEIQKIYGHGYELFAVDVNRRRKQIASACKATNHEDAAVCVWNIRNDYSLMQRLPFHKLTITSVRFSPNGDHLLSASRDRNWALYRFVESEGVTGAGEYKLVAHSRKEQLMHSRIIWSSCWTPDSAYFLTSSRDKQVVVWQVNRQTDEVQPLLGDHILKLNESAYGLDVSAKRIGEAYLVAFGIENGDLLLASWSPDAGWKQLNTINQFHTISIRKVKFHPDGDLLATCGDDGFVRVVRISW